MHVLYSDLLQLVTHYTAQQNDEVSDLQPPIDTVGMKLVLARQSSYKFLRLEVTQTDHTRSLL